MIVLISFFSLIVLFLAFYKYELGVALFLLYCFLVPVAGLCFGPDLVLGKNLFSMILFLFLFVWLRNKSYIITFSLNLIKPFLFLYLLQGSIIIFHAYKEPVLDQLNSFRLDLMGLFLPFVIISIALADKKWVKVMNRIMYVTILISSLYSFFLILRVGQNPYIDSIKDLLYSYNEVDFTHVIEEGVRKFGYISSVYPNVTEYGDFLVFSCAWLLYQFGRNKSFVPRVLFVMVLCCSLICGSRSVLMGMTLVIFSYLLLNRNFKILSIAAASIMVVLLLIHIFIPELFILVESIGNDNVMVASGSTTKMRYDQFMGCFDSIEENPLFGNGYSWTGWYRSTIGRHPIMLSFESIIIQILCNNGIFGLFFHAFFIFILMKTVSTFFSNNPEAKQGVILLLIGYYSYAFFTGDYGMMKVMMCIYAFIIADGFYDSNRSNKYVIYKKLRPFRY